MNTESNTLQMPHQDGEEYHYHVRKLDNRVRVVMSRHCGMLPSSPRNWHVSLEVLNTHRWIHVPGSTEGLYSEPVAKSRVRELYEQLGAGDIRATEACVVHKKSGT
jgi:hypothetical protein